MKVCSLRIPKECTLSPAGPGTNKMLLNSNLTKFTLFAPCSLGRTFLDHYNWIHWLFVRTFKTRELHLYAYLCHDLRLGMSRVFGSFIGFGKCSNYFKVFRQILVTNGAQKALKEFKFHFLEQSMLSTQKCTPKSYHKNFVSMLCCERNVQRCWNSTKARKVPCYIQKWCQLQMLEKWALKCQVNSPKRQSVTS